MTDQAAQLEWACDEQKEVFERGPFPTLASGGYGSSKTSSVLLKALYLADTYPNSRIAIVRRRYNELWKTTVASLDKLLPPSAVKRRNDQSGELELKNGSKFYFLYLEKAETSTVLRGLELSFAVWDQAEEGSEETYDLLLSRLARWDKATIPPELIAQYEANGRKWPWRSPAGVLIPPPYMLLTANPDTELHWLWKRFHPKSKEWREKWRLLGYKLIQFDSRKNKFLSKQTLDALMNHSQDYIDRFVIGVWGRPEGQVFDVSPYSIVEPTSDLLEMIHRDCTLSRVLDHGYTAPTCCGWFAVDKHGNIFAYREYYQISDQVRVHRENITSLSNGESYRASIADSEIFNQMPMKGGGRYSVHGEYTDQKLYPAKTAIWWSRADKNEMASRLRLKEYLYVDPTHKNPITGEMGAPRLYFITRTEAYPNGCREMINELKAAKLTKVGTVDGKPVFSEERDPSVPDHGLDVTRYMIVSRPMIPSTAASVSSIRTFDGYAKLTKADRKRRDALARLDK